MLDPGVIAGIVIGFILAIVIIAAVGIYFVYVYLRFVCVNVFFFFLFQFVLTFCNILISHFFLII